MNCLLDENIDYNKNNLIYQEIKCGLGNQLLILFNLIYLSEKNNYKFIISFREQSIDNKKYNFFNNINFSDKLDNKYIQYFHTIKEKDLSYNEIKLKNRNIILKGYFQSYKYWWDLKYKIKEYLYLDNNLINNIQNIYDKFNKPILSIHIRLGDYLTNPDKFSISSIHYYEKALKFYDLNNYQIILFSDNLILASQMLEPLNLNFINADKFYEDEESQLYMLMLSNIRICSCSTYSLVSCYLNEIYNFVENTEYIFPSTWGNNKQIKYNIDDIMIDHKFIILNNDNLKNYQIYDVVTTLHQKDLDNYKKYLSTNKKFLNYSNNFYYISQDDNKIINSNHIKEDKFPFSKKIIHNYLIKYIPKERIGWYYQQLLKLYIFRIKNKFKNYVLILDADIIFLKPYFPYKKKPKLYYIKKKVYGPYLNSLAYLLSKKKNIYKDISFVSHNMLFNKNILNNLLDDIENKFKKPAWLCILDSVICYVKNFEYKISLFSEYELYANYVKNNYKDFYNFKNINFLDTKLRKFNWKDKKNYTFIGNHSWNR